VWFAILALATGMGAPSRKSVRIGLPAGGNGIRTRGPEWQRVLRHARRPLIPLQGGGAEGADNFIQSGEEKIAGISGGEAPKATRGNSHETPLAPSHRLGVARTRVTATRIKHSRKTSKRTWHFQDDSLVRPLGLS
jgi:hypothetical protein